MVIPDASLEAAKGVLQTGRFTKSLLACPDPTTCGHGSGPKRVYPQPAFHMHIQTMEDSIALHLQSETLWFLPTFDASLANPRGCRLPRYLALASDETAVPPHQDGQDMGAFNLEQTVVLIPKAHILTEALMRIAARDQPKFRTVGAYAMSHFGYIQEYVEPLGRLDPGLLPEPFDKLYKDYPRDMGVEFHRRLLRACGVPLWDQELYR
jgi:hypothetical protein